MFAQLYRRVKMANLVPGVLAPETPPGQPCFMEDYGYRWHVTGVTLRDSNLCSTSISDLGSLQGAGVGEENQLGSKFQFRAPA